MPRKLPPPTPVAALPTTLPAGLSSSNNSSMIGSSIPASSGSSSSSSGSSRRPTPLLPRAAAADAAAAGSGDSAQPKPARPQVKREMSMQQRWRAFQFALKEGVQQLRCARGGAAGRVWFSCLRLVAAAGL